MRIVLRFFSESLTNGKKVILNTKTNREGSKTELIFHER
jgi:hypothetical protein